MGSVAQCVQVLSNDIPVFCVLKSIKALYVQRRSSVLKKGCDWYFPIATGLVLGLPSSFDTSVHFSLS